MWRPPSGNRRWVIGAVFINALAAAWIAPARNCHLPLTATMQLWPSAPLSAHRSPCCHMQQLFLSDLWEMNSNN